MKTIKENLDFSLALTSVAILTGLVIYNVLVYGIHTI